MYFILLATAHDFADDNTLDCFSKTIQEFIGSLESECEVASNWFNENKMIVNPGMFQAIIIDKKYRTILMKSSKLDPRKLKLHLK